MSNLELSAEQYHSYKVIELTVHLQQAIEILDDLNAIDHKFKNKPLNAQLKAIYQPLDKQTRMYNELFKVEQEGMSHFYDITKKNTEYIMGYSLLDKTKICSFLVADEINEKAVEGFINRIIKKGR